MARYTGPKTRIARKLGEAIYGPDKVLAKKNYAPGQHGQNRRKKTSEYGTQLREKQKAKYTYGGSSQYRRPGALCTAEREVCKGRETLSRPNR